MEQNLHQTQTVTVIALIIFALIMIAIGIFSARKTKTMDGFLLGGRKIGAWVSAFAYGTSYSSAVILPVLSKNSIVDYIIGYAKI